MRLFAGDRLQKGVFQLQQRVEAIVMGKFCKMGQPAKNGKRGLVFMLSLFLFGIMLPVTAKAEQVSTDP